MTPRRIEFTSEGERMEGLFYVPDGPGPHPCVVMAGGWCYVKELVQPKFAEVFAEGGIAALIFDYRYMGGSGVSPASTSIRGSRSRTTETRSHLRRDSTRSTEAGSAPGESLTAVGTC